MSTEATVLKCAFCHGEIDGDSFYCDQCGREVLLCIECGKPGRDQWCEEDGAALSPAKSRLKSSSSSFSENETVVEPPNLTSQPATTHRIDVTDISTTSIPVLKLENAKIGLSLQIQPDSVLGRTSGPYAAQLAGFASISGRHLHFTYNASIGWTLTDLGSTNRTRYSITKPSDWNTVPVVEYNSPIKLANGSCVAIANIVFDIRITH